MAEKPIGEMTLGEIEVEIARNKHEADECERSFIEVRERMDPDAQESNKYLRFADTTFAEIKKLRARNILLRAELDLRESVAEALEGHKPTDA